MDVVKIGIYEISERNANFVLTNLYKERDYIGHRMDKFITDPVRYHELEEHYDEIVNTISEVCNFRRTHNCLLEGDKDYGPVA